jgi:hypothetical protein
VGRISACRQRQLTRKVGQRLERGAGSLVDLRAGLGSQAGALLDQVQRGFGLELTRSQAFYGVIERRGQLGQSIGHAVKLSDLVLIGRCWTQPPEP